VIRVEVIDATTGIVATAAEAEAVAAVAAEADAAARVSTAPRR